MSYDVGTGEVQEVGVAGEVVRVVAEPVSAVVLVGEATCLDRGAVGAVEDQDPFGEQGLQPFPHAETLPAAHRHDQRSSVGYAAAARAKVEGEPERRDRWRRERSR